MLIQWKTDIVKSTIKINWHKHFAWLPVRIDAHNLAFFQIVERKGTYNQSEYQQNSLTPGSYTYEYRLIENTENKP